MVRQQDDLRSTSIDVVANMVTSGLIDAEANSLEGETITIVFSDIEASTERATAMGDAAWFALLEEHNVIIRTELARFGGREVKSIGDGFMLVFPSVRRALRFTTSAQERVEAPEGPDLRIRMGIHTGETIRRVPDDLRGALERRSLLLALRSTGPRDNATKRSQRGVEHSSPRWIPTALGFRHAACSPQTRSVESLSASRQVRCPCRLGRIQ